MIKTQQLDCEKTSGHTTHSLGFRKLKQAGLRPTKQRIALLDILFSKGDRHVTPELIHEQSRAVNAKVSLATVYNTLNQFTELGMLRRITVDQGHSYFDTNTAPHQHFFDETTKQLIDISQDQISRLNLPELPQGKSLSGVEIIVRIR